MLKRFAVLTFLFVLLSGCSRKTESKTKEPATTKKKTKEPSKTKEHGKAASPQEQAVAAIKKLRGTVRVDKQKPSKPLPRFASLLVAPFSAKAAVAKQQEWARLLGKKSLVTNTIGMKLKLIPAGEFLMGSSDADVASALRADASLKKEYIKDEGLQHRVRITKAFYLGVYEVTQNEFEKVMGTNPSYFNKAKVGSDTSRFPVDTGSWYDAVEFCNKLSAKEQFAPFYKMENVVRKDGSIKSAKVTVVGGNGYRLPTEAEWEYACRAGTTMPFHFGTTSNGRKSNIDGNYSFGTTTKGPFLKRTSTVGSYTANNFGLHDMHGNVWEWCQDWFDANSYKQFASRTAIDPQGPDSVQNVERVLRGGSWNYFAWGTRSTFRVGGPPGGRYNGGGFRVSRTP